MDGIKRYEGSLLGLAVGDALGTTLEFRRPGTFELVFSIVGGGPFELKPGQWTDDTSMALCLAESLAESKGFDPADQMTRYLRWYREGYMSSTGRCFDIGGATREALQRFERTGDPYSGAADSQTAGNGSIMRLAPVPLYYSSDPFKAIDYCAKSSRTTHAAAEAVDACRYFGGLILGAVTGVAKEELLSTRYTPAAGLWAEAPLTPAILRLAEGSFKIKTPPEIKGTGYVAQSLEAALWSFYTTDNFRDGLLKAVNLGDDADTTGAVYGQLAGAFYGIENIPLEWRTVIQDAEKILALARRMQQAE